MSANPVVKFRGNPLLSSPRGFRTQDQFAQALAHERRRCERSGNFLLLALLHLDRLPHSGLQSPVEAVIAAACSTLRDTDACGWHRQGATLGLIFTDLTEGSREIAPSKIHERLTSVLGAVLPAEAVAGLRIHYHLYPTDIALMVDGDPALDPNTAGPCGSTTYRIVKRGADIACSLFALLLCLPLFLGIAALIKLTSEGPVFFRQKRVGQGGKPFVFLKFRSMFVNNDSAIHKEYMQRMIAGQKVAYEDGTATGLYKIANDPRVTRLGAILRRTSIDELPQLINVLKGEMSLIGPRPPLPYEVERYSPWHRRRLIEARPGITGLWQVNGRSRTSFDEMVRMDLQYVLHWSLWQDFKILLKTPLAVFSGSGAC